MLLCSLFVLRRCNHAADAEQVLDFSRCSVLFVTQSLAVMLAVNYWTKTGGGELVPETCSSDRCIYSENLEETAAKHLKDIKRAKKKKHKQKSIIEKINHLWKLYKSFTKACL